MLSEFVKEAIVKLLQYGDLMGCCGKAKTVVRKAKNIAIGYANLAMGKKYEFNDRRVWVCQQCEKNY